jgi:hypothetical protein
MDCSLLHLAVLDWPTPHLWPSTGAAPLAAAAFLANDDVAIWPLTSTDASAGPVAGTSAGAGVGSGSDSEDDTPIPPKTRSTGGRDSVREGVATLTLDSYVSSSGSEAVYEVKDKEVRLFYSLL